MLASEGPSLPDRPAQITPAFLTVILRDAGALHRAAVTEVHVESIGARASFNAQLARLRLTYDLQEPGAPRTLIAKLPTVDAELHRNAVVFRPGAKEHWFYRKGVARTPVNVPTCYCSAVDAATGESFLLLDDLAPARTGNWVDGASLEQAQLALGSAARLHAAWWGVEPSAVSELARLIENVTEAQDLVERLYQRAWPRFLERAAFEIPNDVRQFGERLLGRIAAAEGTLDGSPRTLIHGDFRLENILYGLRHGEPACWLIDWEDVMLWSGAFDVAWFLGGCLRERDVDAEEGLLRRYHARLIREGVEGYPWAQCYHDYRCAMISSFVQGILTAVPSETADQDGHHFARVLGERFIRAARRLRLHELMPV